MKRIRIYVGFCIDCFVVYASYQKPELDSVPNVCRDCSNGKNNRLKLNNEQRDLVYNFIKANQYSTETDGHIISGYKRTMLISITDWESVEQ